MYKKIKAYFKKKIPQNLFLRYRLGFEWFSCKKMLREIKESEDTIDYLFGAAIHENLGDHLLVLAQRIFLNEIITDRKILEVSSEVFLLYKNYLIQEIKPNSTIYITAGGWMGNIWARDEKILQEIVETFCKHKIVILPQTICFDKNLLGCEELIEKEKLIFRKCKDLTLCLREEQSYQFAKHHHFDANVLLAPDMGLYYYKEVSRNVFINKNRIGLCLRRDREQLRDLVLENKIRLLLRNRGYKFCNIDTIHLFKIPSFCRKCVVDRRIKLFSKQSMILTDRLHGLIFSFLSGTPCMFFDNSTKKISGVYRKWLVNYPYILYIDEQKSLEEIERFIDLHFGNKYDEDTQIEQLFNELKECLYE